MSAEVMKGVGVGTSAVGDLAKGIGQSVAYRRNAKADLAEARLRASERIEAGDAQASRQVSQIAKSGFVMGDSPLKFVEKTSEDALADAILITKGGYEKYAEGRMASVLSAGGGISDAFSRLGEFAQGLEREEETSNTEGTDFETAPTPVFKPRRS
ncbi:MAG: hypothetical protein U9O94_00695 [Nanoarchaeota archaeon]|nr:hypothetical protein [Nanoarchaeota archaeon]